KAAGAALHIAAAPDLRGRGTQTLEAGAPTPGKSSLAPEARADFSGLLGGDGLQVAQRGQAGQRLALELPYALARQVEPVPERLVDVLDRQAGCLRQLGLRRLATKLDLEPAGGPSELLLPLDDVDGHADRARVIGNGALHRLPDPPGGVRRELVPTAPVELLD